jgi:hypothetical protein
MIATSLQIAGLMTVITGGFLVSVGVGLLALGAAAVFVGLAAERG